MTELPDPSQLEAQFLQELLLTSYACLPPLQLLGSRTENVVFRGILAEPASNSITSIILKHATGPDCSSQVFEEILLQSIEDCFPFSITTSIKVPRLLLFNGETKTQVFEDIPDSKGFKFMLYSAGADRLVPASCRFTIGRRLGIWLKFLHSWASGPELGTLRAQMGKNDSKRKLKYEFTFGNFFSALENFPDLVKGHESTLEEIRSMIETEIEKPFTEGNEEYGLIHGDLWSGNILIPNSGWQVDKDASENTLHVIDWEFAQFSHRSTDFGQLIGDLYERKVFGNLENGVQVMEGLIDGYGPLSDEMAFRTAMYVGMHLVIYYLRRPMSGPRVVSEEAIVAGLTIGRDFMVKAWAKDREFFEGSELASLFTVAG